jgi:hypothetical protein
MCSPSSRSEVAHPRSAFGAPPSRGRHQRPGKAGSVVAPVVADGAQRADCRNEVRPSCAKGAEMTPRMRKKNQKTAFDFFAFFANPLRPSRKGVFTKVRLRSIRRGN